MTQPDRPEKQLGVLRAHMNVLRIKLAEKDAIIDALRTENCSLRSVLTCAQTALKFTDSDIAKAKDLIIELGNMFTREKIDEENRFVNDLHS